MRPWKLLAILLAMLGADYLPAQTKAPQPTSASWASSGQESLPLIATPPVVIATTSTKPATLPPDARLPLPDDGLRLTPKAPTTTSGAMRPPRRMPNLGSSQPVPLPRRTIEPAVYVSPPDGMQPVTPIQSVSTSDQREPTKVPPTSAPVESIAPGVNGSVLSLEVKGPASVSSGQLIPCQILVKNLGKLTISGTEIRLPIPAGLRVLTTRPEAQREPEQLIWQLGNLEGLSDRTLDVELLANQSGELRLEPRARFTAAMAWKTFVVRPPFSLTVNSPESAVEGQKVNLDIHLGNHTQQPIRRVSLRCELSEGLNHAQGRVIEADLGEDLAPGQVRTIQLELDATRPGRQEAQFVATGDGGAVAKASAGFIVSESNLSFKVQVPRRIKRGQDLDVELVVSNPGDRSVGPIRLTQTLPQGLDFVSADSQGSYDPVRGTIAWTVVELSSNQTRTVSCRLRARKSGDWAMASSVQAAGMTPIRATRAVHVDSVPTLTLELSRLHDPLVVGQDTTYDVRVYNSGQDPAYGVRLVVSLPPSLIPVSGEGPTAWRIRGQDVFFEPLAEMRGRVDATYRIRVRGGSPGQGSVLADLLANGMNRSMKQELTSHVQAAR